MWLFGTTCPPPQIASTNSHVWLWRFASRPILLPNISSRLVLEQGQAEQAKLIRAEPGRARLNQNATRWPHPRPRVTIFGPVKKPNLLARKT